MSSLPEEVTGVSRIPSAAQTQHSEDIEKEDDVSVV